MSQVDKIKAVTARLRDKFPCAADIHLTADALDLAVDALDKMNFYEPDLCTCNDCDICYPREAIKQIAKKLEA